jgi:hypothetical protein
MLRETISLNVALILADAKSANNEPTTVRPAASPKAKYRRERIVLSQESAASRLLIAAEPRFVTALPS